MFFPLFSDEFRSKVACENDVIQLMCNPYSRIAVYGASYGRTEYESLQCAQPNGAKEDFERKKTIVLLLANWNFNELINSLSRIVHNRDGNENMPWTKEMLAHSWQRHIR